MSNEVGLLSDVRGVHPYDGVAQEPKRVLDKLLSLLQRCRVELKVIVGFIRSPPVRLARQVLRQYA